jgi:4-hydroxy-tetrahydrodipicolinate reductase
MIRVAVNGAAGRMGRLIVKNVSEDEELQLVQAFDVARIGEDAGEVAGVGRLNVPIINASELGKLDADVVDVVIDFSVPAGTLNVLRAAKEKGVKAVVGTTGFTQEQREEIEEISRDIPVVLSPNFSVGVNVFWKLIERAAELLKGYDVEIVEIHHRFKRDAPSGTALKAAEVIKKVVGDRETVFGREGEALRGDEIGVFAVRGGDVVGEHTVYFIGMGERVEITHRAQSREAFSRGAIRAAKWIAGVDRPGLYSMDDVLGL